MTTCVFGKISLTAWAIRWAQSWRIISKASGSSEIVIISTALLWLILIDKSCNLPLTLTDIAFLAKLFEIEFAISKPVIFFENCLLCPSGKDIVISVISWFF